MKGMEECSGHILLNTREDKGNAQKMVPEIYRSLRNLAALICANV